jgi:hypothetical protein
MPLRAQFAALVLAVAGSLAHAADVVGYSEAFDTLYRVDLTTRTAQEIGHATPNGVTRYPIIVGLTFSPDGKLYAVADGLVKTLLRINPGTGLATPVGILDLGSTAREDIGLAFTADGNLWLSTVSGDLWQVNPGNAGVTHVGKLGTKINITGLASRGNQLYGAGSQGNNNLYLINTATGQASLVGAYGAGISYVTAASPAFDANGQFWVLLDYVPTPNDNDPTPPWSDLAAGDLSGKLVNQGNVTAPANTVSYEDLLLIGLRGFAITPPAAPTGTAVVQTPTLSLSGLATLLLLLVAGAGTWLRRNHPIP